MEKVPWTVAAFQQRRRKRWKAIRLWLLLLVAGVVGFLVPFYLERAHVTVDGVAEYHLLSQDMTGTELLTELVSLVVMGVGMVGIVIGTQRHYRCPSCDAPVTGDELHPAVCGECGAKLAE